MGTCVCCNLHCAEDRFLLTADEEITVREGDCLAWLFLALGMTLVC